MSARPMNFERFVELSEAWGSQIERWPAAEQKAAYVLAAADTRASDALLAAAELELWLEPAPPPSAQLRSRILADAARSAPAPGFWSRLWEELGGFQLVAPALASSLVLAFVLVQLDPASVSAEADEGDLISLALLTAEDEEFLP